MPNDITKKLDSKHLGTELPEQYRVNARAELIK